MMGAVLETGRDFPLLMRFLLVFALACACVGCNSILDFLGIDPNETLEVPHPNSTGRSRTYNNSLEDRQGLAGLEVTLTGSVDRTFTAEDLPIRPFGIAARGSIAADVSLIVDRAVIAEGRASWALRPNTRWLLRFYRGVPNPAPYIPPAPGYSPNHCDWPGCEGYWRFEISEDHRGSEGEALWVVVFGYEPCPEDVICN